MTDRECVELLRWALPRLRMRWAGFRRVRRQVCRRISRRMAELGIPDAAAYRAHLESHPAEWPVLDACCRISISRFARDRRVFEQLAGALLPELATRALAQGRRALSVWSAGCASGEEPYSVKLAWELAAGSAFPGLELRIVATDADPVLLERAARAVYRASSLADLPEAWRERGFQRLDGAYRLREEFRAGIELRRQDLREGMPAPPFDLILCRNLAFTYFDEALQRDILDGLARRLVAGGALIVGSHETLPEHPRLAPSRDGPWLRRAGPGPA